MHPAAYAFIANQVGQTTVDLHSVLEYGSRDINGSVRPLFTRTKRYLGIDLRPGKGVDQIADAATYTPVFRPDAIVCCEVLEHAERWRDILTNAWHTLPPRGLLFLTCACRPRPAHGADGAPAPRLDEYYENIEPFELLRILSYPNWHNLLLVRHAAGDIHLTAQK